MENGLSLKEKIEAENEAFEQMTNAEKRVRIAEDCIERIRLEQITASKGMVVEFGFNKNKSENLKELLNDGIQCKACAKGGLFLSYVGRVNNFEKCEIQNDNRENDNEHQKLLEVFDIKQLALIEAAFEGKPYLSVSLRGNTQKYRKFFKKHGGKYDYNDFEYPVSEDADDNNNRLIAICENIIANKGTFVL
jgi:hypothetical protein